MKHDHQSFAAAKAYGDVTADLVQRFMPMVRKQAWHIHGAAMPGTDVEDLMQAGLVALTECAQRHAPAGTDGPVADRPVTGGPATISPVQDGFAAYAKTRVRGAMIDLIRRAAPLSRGAMQRSRELREAQTRLRGRLGREPEMGELAAAMGLKPAELEQLRATSQSMQSQSIDDAYSDHDMAFCDPSPDSFALLAAQENREELIAAIAQLPERLQLVIQLYFVEEMNLTEIGTVLSVSVPRVHQLKDQALKRLKAELEA